MVGDCWLGEVKEGYQLANADFAGVLAEYIDKLQAHRVTESFGDHCHALGLLPLNVGIDDWLTARLTGGALLLWSKLEFNRHE